MPRPTTAGSTARSLHALGVICGLAAGAWLGAAEAPTKLVTAGFSPFIISLGMVAGVFVARWTRAGAAQGHRLVWATICATSPHLIVWAVLAGMLWAVANTLTVFAIRDVGLSIAFPLWNTNSLVGLFWGWLLFNELRGAGARDWVKVLGRGGRHRRRAPACWPTRPRTRPSPARRRGGRWASSPPSAPACCGGRCTSPTGRRTSAG